MLLVYQGSAEDSETQTDGAPPCQVVPTIMTEGERSGTTIKVSSSEVTYITWPEIVTWSCLGVSQCPLLSWVLKEDSWDCVVSHINPALVHYLEPANQSPPSKRKKKRHWSSDKQAEFHSRQSYWDLCAPLVAPGVWGNPNFGAWSQKMLHPNFTWLWQVSKAEPTSEALLGPGVIRARV